MSIIKNKLKAIIIIITSVLLVAVLTYTYAFFTSINKDQSTIVGDASTSELSLIITRIVPQNNDLSLVPLEDAAVQNALLGVNGTSSCVDSNGNLSCQVYKINLKNTGDTNLELKGNMYISPTSENIILNNMKWQELNSETNIKSDAVINGMDKSILDNDLILKKGLTKDYYIVIWLSEIDRDQSTEDHGPYSATITFELINGKGVTASFKL